jgi:hypothetical protein
MLQTITSRGRKAELFRCRFIGISDSRNLCQSDQFLSSHRSHTDHSSICIAPTIHTWAPDLPWSGLHSRPHHQDSVCMQEFRPAPSALLLPEVTVGGSQALASTTTSELSGISLRPLRRVCCEANGGRGSRRRTQLKGYVVLGSCRAYGENRSSLVSRTSV